MQPGSATARQPHIVHLEEMMKELFALFYQRNQAHPKRIIMYRDGVSESQYGEVAVEELKGIREACAEVVGKGKCKVTIVAVNKRHHTRFFPVDGRDGDRSGNVPAGTVVDSGKLKVNLVRSFINFRWPVL